jgi:hypothetical protein
MEEVIERQPRAVSLEFPGLPAKMIVHVPRSLASFPDPPDKEIKMTPDPPISLNARVGAATLMAGTLFQLALSHATVPLVPLKLLALGILATGIWAFADEMGTRKPLVKAGFIAFVSAVFARSIALVVAPDAQAGRFYLLFAFAALLALFLWSVAFLHRQRDLKLVGAAGVVATLAPLGALIAGHLILGLGALFGIDALMRAAEGQALTDLTAIRAIDMLILLWSAFAAWFLISGRIRFDAGA